MASMLTSSAVDRRLKTMSGQTKDYKIGFAAFLLSMQYSGVRASTGFFQNHITNIK